MKEQGLILKNYWPKKRKILVLNQLGECAELAIGERILIEKLRPGYNILYNILLDKLFDVEIVATPVLNGWQSLQFLHQVLELCSLILPHGQVTSEAVFLLQSVVSQDFSTLSLAQKRLFVCVILAVVGFYPEIADTQEYLLMHKVQKINRLNIVDFITFKIDDQIDFFLIKWISSFLDDNASARLASLFGTIY